jgi:hypothetical protein
MNAPDSSRLRKLVDYTKQRGSQHLCATSTVSTIMTKPFLSQEHHSYNTVPSMVSISASSVDATDTNCRCASEIAEPNDFLLKVHVPPRANRRQATNDLRERCQRSQNQTNERQSTVFEEVTPVTDIFVSNLGTTCSDPARVEPIDFFLKIPPRTQRQRSDLRERFQSSRSQHRKKVGILQTILRESSTRSLASRKLPPSRSNSDSLHTV